MVRYVYTKKRRAATKKAQRTWRNMSKRARAKAMPGGRGRIRNR